MMATPTNIAEINSPEFKQQAKGKLIREKIYEVETVKLREKQQIEKFDG